MASIEILAPDGSGEVRIDGTRRTPRPLAIIDLPPANQQVSGTFTSPGFSEGEFWYYFIVPGMTFWPLLELNGNTLTWTWQFETMTGQGVRLVCGVW